MFDPDTLPRLKRAVVNQTQSDKSLLEEILRDVERLRPEVRSIRPRSTTAVSLVAADGGNNQLQFDPFHVQLVRVVDSYGKELFLDVISPTTDPDELTRRHLDPEEGPRSPLGRLMADLNKETLQDLSHMIPKGEKVRTEPHLVSPSWVLVYRDLCEWAVLYERICYHTFATDTLIVRDGLLRSKIFRGELFIRMYDRMRDAISRIKRQDRRKVDLVGIAKHSQVIERYRLAMSLADIMKAGEPRYAHVPRELEAKAYRWPEWARGTETEGEGEAPKFVIGDMHFVRFGPRSGDPIWAVDLLTSETPNAPEIFAYLLADAIDGFPVPFYPRCLQKAHEFAQIVDFDLDILQDTVVGAVKTLVGSRGQDVIDAMRLVPDVTGRRYE